MLPWLVDRITLHPAMFCGEGSRSGGGYGAGNGAGEGVPSGEEFGHGHGSCHGQGYPQGFGVGDNQTSPFFETKEGQLNLDGSGILHGWE